MGVIKTTGKIYNYTWHEVHGLGWGWGLECLMAY
jgi:hypothetical protein